MNHNHIVIAGERGWREVRESKERISGDGRRVDLGGKHTIECADDVLWNCAPETCIILLTNVTSISSIKRKKIEKEN